MLRIGTWIEHPHYGKGRIANHQGTRYIVSFPGVGLRDIDLHPDGRRIAFTDRDRPGRQINDHLGDVELLRVHHRRGRPRQRGCQSECNDG